ncbi:MAG: hypothetical protein PHT12_02015 [Patescibacteria group bacterium]|nr:hypothetical protein [Patescibacteria group bacterium]
MTRAKGLLPAARCRGVAAAVSIPFSELTRLASPMTVVGQPAAASAAANPLAVAAYVRMAATANARPVRFSLTV